MLKEAKQKELPVAYLTNFISRCWEETGRLKEEIKALKEEFSNITSVEETIDDLIDSYLIAIGKLEDILAKGSDPIEVLTEDLNKTSKISEEANTVAFEKEDLEEKNNSNSTNTRPQEDQDETFEYYCEFED